ncbi:Protein tilB [Entophlyctis luteolus]|nr:Protein tilB [Entophlyctis luteolus]
MPPTPLNGESRTGVNPLHPLLRLYIKTKVSNNSDTKEMTTETYDSKLTQELLRKRAEHNDGELSTLKEVALHQFDIEKIENLDVFCRHLEILYLQNNQINKIENLHKLKELKYLNLALNNICKIENLDRCESLSKLDLTVNFVSDPLDLENLKRNEMLRELFLVGNPICQIDGYREFAIITLPQLKVLDGREIEKSERIKASQVYESLRHRFLRAREEGQKDDAAGVNIESTAASCAEPERLEEDLEQLKHDFKTKTVPYTPETRRQTAREIEQMNGPPKDDHTKPKPPKPANTAIRHGPDGRVLQRNEGKWNFSVDSSSHRHALFLRVELSKFLDSSFVDIKIDSGFAQVVVKTKVLTVTFDESIRPESAFCERSKLTGELLVVAIKTKAPEGLTAEDVLNESKRASVVNLQEVKGGQPFTRNKRKERLEKMHGGLATGKIVDSKHVSNTTGGSAEYAFEDDPEVPPLI